jgi:hypothetical protein
MIKQGENGSINFFYKNKMICSRPLNKFRTIEKYEKERDKIMLEALLEKFSLQHQIKIHKYLIKRARYEDLVNNEKRENMDILAVSFLILIKLKQIDPDGDTEGLLICCRKKTMT